MTNEEERQQVLKSVEDRKTLERTIINLIEDGIEDTRVPDAIAAHADARTGKVVTVKDAEQLEKQLGIPVRISRRFGMTQVTWATGTLGNPWASEGSILLAHGDTHVRWPTIVEVHQKNPAYFEARDRRNESRRQLLAEQNELNRIPYIKISNIEKAVRAITQFREARDELQKLIDFGEPLHVINCDIRKLLGKPL